MKKIMSLMLACVLALSALTACSSKTESKVEVPTTGGKVLNIYAWNEEFKGFFDKYYADKIPEGVEVVWTIVPSDNGAYQQALDNALYNQANADADNRVDMFLAEADYILKYAGSDYTQDIKALGVTNFSNTYEYTVQAASDANGVVKGVSFQCCPSALIYRRSIAKDVLGTDDPAEVQTKLDTWEKFDRVAAQAKEKGYLMTASYAETYRVFSNNVSKPWVDAENNIQFDDKIVTWMDQAEKYVAEGYTLTEGVWDAGKNAEMGADGRAMCFFGPAWYFNFCMGPAKEQCSGDWAICMGPEAHFWGGTWLLCPTGTDNADIVADIMNAFINDTEICENLIKNESQFTNNKAVNAAFARDPEYGSEFLGGQNDVAVFVDLADKIQFKNITIYDQYMNEGLQTFYVEYLKGAVESRDAALKNFYTKLNEELPTVVTPE